MKTLKFISLIPFLLGLFSCWKNEELFLGSYQSVTESEWELTLTISKHGKAEIVSESWDPGEFEKRSIEKKSAHWKNLSNHIILSYDNKFDTLEFDPILSLKVIGKNGVAPGLLQNKPNYEGIFNNVPLWKLPHNF